MQRPSSFPFFPRKCVVNQRLITHFEVWKHSPTFEGGNSPPFGAIYWSRQPRVYVGVQRCSCIKISWRHHQMETFSALLAVCVENSLVTYEFPSQRPVTRSYDVLFDPRLNKRVNEQSWLGIWDAIALIMTSLQCTLNVLFVTVICIYFPFSCYVVLSTVVHVT